jgi:hypothetical protein
MPAGAAATPVVPSRIGFGLYGWKDGRMSILEHFRKSFDRISKLPQFSFASVRQYRASPAAQWLRVGHLQILKFILNVLFVPITSGKTTNKFQVVIGGFLGGRRDIPGIVVWSIEALAGENATLWVLEEERKSDKRRKE